MWEVLKKLIAQNAKAIAAGVVAMVVLLLAHFHLGLPVLIQQVLSAAIVALIVWVAKNRAKTNG